jgi:hypothetical protein
MSNAPTRISLERIFSWVTAALALATLVWPDWIEILTGFDPDQGSGAVEVAVVVAMIVLCIGLRVDVRRLQRRAAAPEVS